MLQGEQKKSVLQFIVKNIVFRYWHEVRTRDKFFFKIFQMFCPIGQMGWVNKAK